MRATLALKSQRSQTWPALARTNLPSISPRLDFAPARSSHIMALWRPTHENEP